MEKAEAQDQGQGRLMAVEKVVLEEQGQGRDGDGEGWEDGWGVVWYRSICGGATEGVWRDERAQRTAGVETAASDVVLVRASAGCRVAIAVEGGNGGKRTERNK